MPQSFLLLIATNLALTGFLGCKWSLWPVTTWLAVQRSKAIFFLTLYNIINDMKLFQNVLIAPQPCHSHFCSCLLPIWAYAECLGWKWSSWPVPTWLAVQWSIAVFSLNLYDSINDMTQFWNVCITPEPCHSYFCWWLLPVCLKLDFWTENGAYCLCRLGWSYNRSNLYFSRSYMIVSMIWSTSALSALHLNRVTVIFVVDCCQFGLNWRSGLKMEVMACADLVGGTTEQRCLFPDLIW